MRHVIQRTRIPKSKFKLEGAFLNQLETRLIARTPPVKSIRHLLGTFLNTTDQESGRALFTLVSKLNEAYFPAIRDMELVLTEGCNLACTYCFEGKMKRARTMKPDIARRAVDLLMVYSRDVEEISILFFGGEPFLNFKVLRIVTEYAEEQAKQHCKKLRFNCTSNCTNLTDEILGFVSQHRIAVLASVDGLQEAHDMYRKDRGGRGTFVRVLGNLKRLKLAQGYLGAKVTVMPANVSRLYDDVRGLYDHGITTFVIGYASGIKWPEESGKCYWNQLRKLKRWQSSERTNATSVKAVYWWKSRCFHSVKTFPAWRYLLIGLGTPLGSPLLRTTPMLLWTGLFALS